MTSALSRPVHKSVPAFVAWTASILIGLGVIGQLLAGGGGTGVIEIAFGFLWLGWVFVLALIPVWLVFRWSLARFGWRLRGSLPLRGALVGVLVWTAAALALFGIELAMGALSPDSRPTVTSVAGGLFGAGIIGGVLGLLEGRAIAKVVAPEIPKA